MSIRNSSFVVLITILSVAAIGLRALANHAPVPMRKPLDSLPYVIQGMSGKDTGISEEILEVLGNGEFLSRIYEKPGATPIFVYIAYYPKQERGDAIHSPKNCLPGSGWETILSDRVPLHFPPQEPVEINRFVVQKDRQKQLVYYWYQSHGRTIASEYWGKIYLVLDALRMGRTDVALVRVSTPMDPNQAGLSESQLRAFVDEFYPVLPDFLPE